MQDFLLGLCGWWAADWVPAGAAFFLLEFAAHFL